jgi:high-affinity Fe2+/Pb2+ permease
VVELNPGLFGMGLLGAAGTFPAAFTAVYVFGAIAALAIGFLALKKAREVNVKSFDQSSVDPEDGD